MKRVLVLSGLALLLLACSPAQRPRGEVAQADQQPQVQACNDVVPNRTRLVSVEDQGPVSTLVGELRGGAVTPGLYELRRAVRIGQATGWQGERAVALQVTESDAGVLTFNWAGAAANGEIDRWTATFSDTQPQARLSYSCGRIGDVDATFAADANALQLRLPDGGNGSLQLNFARRS